MGSFFFLSFFHVLVVLIKPLQIIQGRRKPQNIQKMMYRWEQAGEEAESHMTKAMRDVTKSLTE